MIEYRGLPLTIKMNPRARRVLVKLVPGQGLEVVVPKRFDAGLVPGLLDGKRAWIDRTRARMEASGVDLSGRLPELPEIINFQAVERTYRVDYLDRIGRVSVIGNGGRLMVRGPIEDQGAILDSLQGFTAIKAREILLPLLDDMSRRLAMPYASMRVRRQKTRWGSCSARGTISLNAKLLFLPGELVSHLLLHELCHTRHLNHSAKYWALVARIEPDFMRLEEELKHGSHHVPSWFV